MARIVYIIMPFIIRIRRIDDVFLLLLHQAGLMVGDMILSVNKDTLIGASYDSVSIFEYKYLSKVN